MRTDDWLGGWRTSSSAKFFRVTGCCETDNFYVTIDLQLLMKPAVVSWGVLQDLFYRTATKHGLLSVAEDIFFISLYNSEFCEMAQLRRMYGNQTFTRNL